jgi:hypothetical protein
MRTTCFANLIVLDLIVPIKLGENERTHDKTTLRSERYWRCRSLYCGCDCGYTGTQSRVRYVVTWSERYWRCRSLRCGCDYDYTGTQSRGALRGNLIRALLEMSLTTLWLWLWLHGNAVTSALRGNTDKATATVDLRRVHMWIHAKDMQPWRYSTRPTSQIKGNALRRCRHQGSGEEMVTYETKIGRGPRRQIYLSKQVASERVWFFFISQIFIKWLAYAAPYDIYEYL